MISDARTHLAKITDRSLLLLDDDAPLRHRLGLALALRGFDPILAETVGHAMRTVRDEPPAFAVLDLQLEDGSGLRVAQALRTARPDARIIILTGYGAYATAVARMQVHAVEFLNKPADADEIAEALLFPDLATTHAPGRPAADRASLRS